MRHPGHMRMLLANAVLAIAGQGFSGAQRPGNARGAVTPTEHVPPAFDPLQLMTGRQRLSNKRRHHTSWPTGCGARQSARYLKQGASINVHFERRMKWNAEVYPRVLASQKANAERNAGTFYGRRAGRMFRQRIRIEEGGAM